MYSIHHQIPAGFYYLCAIFRACERCAFFLIVRCVSFAQTRSVTDAEVQRVNRSALLIDTHNDITSRTVDGYDIGKNKNDGHTNVTSLKEGGVGAQFFAVYVSSSYVNGNHSAHRTLEMIDTVRHGIVERYPNDFALATTADDIERIHKQGKIAALMGIEGGHAIEDNLGLLRDYFDLGIRYMTLTHTNTNNWADSSGDIDKPGVEHHNGLTPFGKQVVREMNRLGMMIDISHTADKTFWDALAVSKAPIIASHSSCRALCNVPRNMTDEMIAALGKKGGVIQINFNCGFLSEKSAAAAKNVQDSTLPGAQGEDADHRGISQESAARDARRRGGAHRSCGEGGWNRRGGNRQRFRWRVLHATRLGRRVQISQPHARVAGEGLLGRGHSQDLWREHSARDARGGSGSQARTIGARGV